MTDREPRTRRGRRWLPMVLLPVAILVAAPSCSAFDDLARAVGRSADELRPAVKDVARTAGRDPDTLAKAIKESEVAQDIIELAKDPGVEIGCKYLGRRATGTDVQVVPGGPDWVRRMLEAQQRQEPINEACEIAGKISGAF